MIIDRIKRLLPAVLVAGAVMVTVPLAAYADPVRSVPSLYAGSAQATAITYQSSVAVPGRTYNHGFLWYATLYAPAKVTGKFLGRVDGTSYTLLWSVTGGSSRQGKIVYYGDVLYNDTSQVEVCHAKYYLGIWDKCSASANYRRG